MTRNDLAYYRARLEAERRSAESASNPVVAAVHRQLADEYAALIIANGFGVHKESTSAVD
ncbi:hypothetical protein SH591_08030 [Sphingomonas sp. LY54]|uniref:hypothetical protein n=1 Tax=Sphingomonas sp. LY54 TaxID=3095343 RepID=UPI002D7A134F|nr:hypothetical protein [Sphingomonas sp. LY54]WRP30104.1 hypothetical protein SH591_08030 [Sphingomonas sp. LY54]